MPNIYKPVKKTYRSKEALNSDDVAHQAEVQVLKAMDVLKNSSYKPKFTFSKFLSDRQLPVKPTSQAISLRKKSRTLAKRQELKDKMANSCLDRKTWLTLHK